MTDEEREREIEQLSAEMLAYDNAATALRTRIYRLIQGRRHPPAEVQTGSEGAKRQQGGA